MPLLRNRNKETDKKVEAARFQVDLALLKFTDLLEQVQDQAEKAKEELDERRTG